MSDYKIISDPSVWQSMKWSIVCVNPSNPDEKMEFDSIEALNKKLFDLKAEVERLTKAGDALYDAWIGYHGEQILENYKHGTGEMCRAWNATKEGKQP